MENDDRPGMYSIADLLPLHAMVGTPLVFDYLHHALVPDGLSEAEALAAALATWPPGVRPVVHYRSAAEGVLGNNCFSLHTAGAALLACAGVPSSHLLYAPRARTPYLRPPAPFSEPSEDPSRPRRAHSRMLTQPFDLHGWEAEVDVMLEAKGMEHALLFYRWEALRPLGGQATAVDADA